MASKARRSRWRFARALVAACGVVLAAWLASALGVYFWGRRDRAEKADAIVVLGAAQYVGRPSPVLKARLDHAISLWKRGYAPLLVMTGGYGERDTTSEAAVGRKYALAHGVPDSAVLMETRGRTTSESMRAVATMLLERGAGRTILVSDPFHLLRLSILARRFGLQARTSPAPSSPIAANRAETFRYVMGESVKVPWAFVFERK